MTYHLQLMDFDNLHFIDEEEMREEGERGGGGEEEGRKGRGGGEEGRREGGRRGDLEGKCRRVIALSNYFLTASQLLHNILYGTHLLLSSASARCSSLSYVSRASGDIRMGEELLRPDSSSLSDVDTE